MSTLTCRSLHDFLFWKTDYLRRNGNHAGKGGAKVSVIDWISRILVIVGGLNWGLIGAANYNLVSAIFGDGSMASKVVYVLVGLGAIWELIRLAFREPVATNRT